MDIRNNPDSPKRFGRPWFHLNKKDKLPSPMSAFVRITDLSRTSRNVCFVPNADINCRDCDVRSLAGPEPDRKVFAKFKHLLRKAAAHPAETICVTIGETLRVFTPTECATGYA
jgi:hypothetical protein